MTRAIVAPGGATAGLLTAAWQRPLDAPLGFTQARASVQARVERRFLSLPSADFIRDAHRVLTDKPHMAGTARDRELAEWTRDRFQNFGLEEVAITTHDVLLPWPLEVNVEMTAPRRWRASMREEPVSGGDYDWLSAQGIDVRGKIALVRYSVPYSYRGFKALTAQQRGAAGLLIYSDPADDGGDRSRSPQARRR